MNNISLSFLGSATNWQQMPNTLLEVAVIGRSNVGKSSLINMLADNKKLAYTSKTPGRTQTINIFNTVQNKALVDLPGYGYAKAAKTKRQQWGKMTEDYLSKREQLIMTMILVDSLVGPTELDLEVVDWFRENEIDHSIIGTKIDKVKSSKRISRKRELASRLELDTEDIFWVSIKDNKSIKQLKSLIVLWLEL